MNFLLWLIDFFLWHTWSWTDQVYRLLHIWRGLQLYYIRGIDVLFHSPEGSPSTEYFNFLTSHDPYHFMTASLKPRVESICQNYRNFICNMIYHISWLIRMTNIFLQYRRSLYMIILLDISVSYKTQTGKSWIYIF